MRGGRWPLRRTTRLSPTKMPPQFVPLFLEGCESGEAKSYRERAAQLRLNAEDAVAAEAKAGFLSLAFSYEQLAKAIERRMLGNQSETVVTTATVFAKSCRCRRNQ